MNYGGDTIISRPTRASGRILLALGLATVLVKKYEIDTSQLTLLNIPIAESQVVGITWVVLVLQMVVHSANWMGDFLSLGRWNSALKDKGVETLWDGGGKMKGRIEFLFELLEHADVSREKEFGETIEQVLKELRAIRRSMWLFDLYAIFYVVFINYLLPVALAVCALILLYNG